MSPTAQAHLPLLGAYAMAPTDADEAAAFYRALADEPIGGLEIPAPEADPDSAAVLVVAGRLQHGWQVMLTTIPVVMSRLTIDPAYGLASADDTARALALADVDGERRVNAIEVHSAPGPVLGNGDALARSLETIAGWDLAGAGIVLEHCDALVAGQPAAKGFFALTNEIAAIRTAGDPTPVGVGINWGRSTIEGRNARTPVEHVAVAARAGLLHAVVLSGASDRATAWGDAWGDAHIPSRGADIALSASDESLLDDEAIAQTLAAAGADTLLAVKVSVRPRDVTNDQRVAVARAVLAQVQAHRVA